MLENPSSCPEKKKKKGWVAFTVVQIQPAYFPEAPGPPKQTKKKRRRKERSFFNLLLS